MAQLKDLIVNGPSQLIGTATVSADPTTNLGIATKQYVDNNITNLNIGKYYDLTGGIAIPSNADLNNYTTVGTYVAQGDSIAKTHLHNPFSAEASTSMTSYFLYVKQLGTTSIITQTLVFYSTGQEAVRTYGGNSWSTWKMEIIKETGASTAVGSTTQPVYVSEKGMVTAITGNIANGTTGNAATATTLETARTIQTDLTSTTAASFNGSANVTPGVTGILGTANGGTGNADGYIRTGQKSGTTIGTKATIEGSDNEASGNYSHAEGYNTTASGTASHAEGSYNTAEGDYSAAGGKGNIVKGNYSFAYGMATDINSTTLTLRSSNVTPFQRNVYVLSSGTSSTGVIWTCPDGSYTNCYFEQVDNPENNGILLNYYTFYYPANPSNTLSNAVQFTQPFIYGDDNGSYTFNIYILPTNALNFIYGNETFAYGKGLKTFYPVTSLFGKYNTLTTDNSYIEIVGNGTSNSARSDARRLDQNGNEELAGNLLPMVNNSKDLGTYNKAWKDIYVYNKIQFPNNNTIEYLADSNSIFQISTTQNDLYLLSMRNISQTASFNINLTSVASNINLTVPGNTDTTGKISFCRVNDNAEDIEIGFIDRGGLQLNEGNDVIFKSKSEDTSSSDPGGIHWFKSNGTTRKATIKVPNIDDVSHSYPAPIYENTYHSTTGYRHLGLTNAFFAKAGGTSQTRNSVAGYDISLYNNIRGSGFCNDHPVQPGDIISVYFPTATTTSILALHIGSRPFGSTSSQEITYQSLRMYKGAMSAIGAITAGKTITFIAMWAIKNADGGIGSQTPTLCLYKIAEC